MIGKMKGKKLFSFIIMIKKRFPYGNKSEIIKDKLMYFTGKKEKEITLLKAISSIFFLN